MTQGSSKICYKTRHNNTSFITQQLNKTKQKNNHNLHRLTTVLRTEPVYYFCWYLLSDIAVSRQFRPVCHSPHSTAFIAVYTINSFNILTAAQYHQPLSQCTAGHSHINIRESTRECKPLPSLTCISHASTGWQSASRQLLSVGERRHLVIKRQNQHACTGGANVKHTEENS